MAQRVDGHENVECCCIGGFIIKACTHCGAQPRKSAPCFLPLCPSFPPHQAIRLTLPIGYPRARGVEVPAPRGPHAHYKPPTRRRRVMQCSPAPRMAGTPRMVARTVVVAEAVAVAVAAWPWGTGPTTFSPRQPLLTEPCYLGSNPSMDQPGRDATKVRCRLILTSGRVCHGHASTVVGMASHNGWI